MENQQPLGVMVVEDDPGHRARYIEHLAADGRLRLLQAYDRGQAAAAAVASLCPDVALVDLGLPDMDGFELIERIRRDSPATDVLVVSIFGSEYHLLTAIECGATGYLLKDSGQQDFNGAIHAVRAGESPISPPLARHLLRRCIGMAPPNPQPDALARPLLSEREVTILEGIARGEAAHDIGLRLFISPHTVKTHVKNIYAKLEAHSRVEAVRVAKRRGLIRP